MKFRALILTAAIVASAAFLVSQPAPPERPGTNADGSVTLVSGWTLRPAGRQIPLSTFPVNSVVSPDGKFLLVLQAGYLKPSISVHAMADFSEISRTEVDDAWLGMTFAPGTGGLLYVAGGSRACIYEFALTAEGRLEPRRTFDIVPADKRQWQDFAGDVQVSPDGRLLYATLLSRNIIAVINPQSGMVIEQFKTGLRPYRILFHPDGKSFFVTSWADGSLYHHDAMDGRVLWRQPIGPGLMDIVFSSRKPAAEEEDKETEFIGRLFVSSANTNQVHVLGLTESKEVKRLETINVSFTPMQPAGMTPGALAVSPDQTRLAVVCFDANAVAIADISKARSTVMGFVPTGWYPTAARLLANGTLLAFNGRGPRSLPNPQGPNPTKRTAPMHLGNSEVEYVGRIQKGTMSIVEAYEEKLPEHSRTFLRNTPYRDSALELTYQVPPIQHVVYIIKENRTYDQVLGDLGIGNGDPSLTLFGENVTPNHHKLAREFVLFDNFYVSADVSADGHNWSTAAIAPPYVQRMWPNSYAQRRRHYDYEGGEPAALPPAGYLWTNAAQKGLTMRNYGWWATNITPAPASGRQIQAVRDPVLAKVTCMDYRNFDLDYTDLERVKVFIRELSEFEAKGEFPQIVFLKIPNDHTSGAAAGKIHALSAAADNDAAFGQVIEALSRSKFWPHMAVFVLEDDAQNGPDHIDSHRSPAFLLSPYTRGRGIDSSMYNTTSVLRSIEVLLGLRPMTHFDAAARPMFAAFRKEPDLTPYTAEKPRISLTERNPANTAAAARSAQLDFSDADRIDDDELNDILWRTIKGTEPPVPVRSYFGR